MWKQITLRCNGTRHSLAVGKHTFLPQLYADCQLSADGLRLQLWLHPKQPIVIENIEVEIALPTAIAPTDELFCNGFQSWSETRYYSARERMLAPRRLARPFLGQMADATWYSYSGKPGDLHSWTYTLLRHRDGHGWLWGSLSEEAAYTVWQYRVSQQRLTAAKDMHGHHLEHSLQVFDLLAISGHTTHLTSAYLQAAGYPLRSRSRLYGWTSWYYHYTRITPSLIRERTTQLARIAAHIVPEAGIPVVQIDDGWQQRVGDWQPNTAFSGQMAALASDIRKAGLLPGLWLAPMIVASGSERARTHQQWLVQHPSGNGPLRVGYNPLWKGGWFYALDIEQQGVQDYLYNLVQQARQWGFSLLKLDFLYAAATVPRPNRSRAQLMHQTMQLLREACGSDIRLLACGVPLAAAWGRADYCRIGADIHSAWEHPILRWLRHAERASTRLALTNTLSRYHLHQQPFANDPDVVLLRTHRHRLTPAQQELLLLCHALLGGVLFTSDDLGRWSAETVARYQQIVELLPHTSVEYVSLSNGIILLRWYYQSVRYTLRGRLDTGMFEITHH